MNLVNHARGLPRTIALDVLQSVYFLNVGFGMLVAFLLKVDSFCSEKLDDLPGKNDFQPVQLKYGQCLHTCIGMITKLLYGN